MGYFKHAFIAADGAEQPGKKMTKSEFHGI